jgi:LPS-assembly protein
MGLRWWAMAGRKRRCAAASLVLLAALVATPALAQYLPPGFFDASPEPGIQAEIEADYLTFDGKDTISARGGVILRYGEYVVGCDVMRYNRSTHALFCEGNVTLSDPQGSRYTMDRVEVTGGFKSAVLSSMTLTTSDGALITAADAEYADELQIVLNDATYAPCGRCIDAKGNRIGWKVRAVRFVQDKSNDMVYLDQPSLEILGVPVAWLPWLALPDPSVDRPEGFQLPSFDYSDETGLGLNLPYRIAAGDTASLLLTPRLMSRQGVLLGAEWEQDFSYGWYKVAASAVYQLDPGAFAGTVGERDWRGAIDTYGRFTPVEDWTVGWQLTAFTDAAYLDDYGLQAERHRTNELFATYITDDAYIDVRLQQFLLLGNYGDADQDRQALAIPNKRTAHYFNDDRYGQIVFRSRLLGVHREDDDTETYGIVPYNFGVEGSKAHLALEGSWENQLIGPGGLVFTPYLGLRADAAAFSGPAGSAMPGDYSLLEATPIAAMDVRWPLLASNGLDSHLFEPIGQLVWRGSDTSLVGITNDDAQSFVLDDTNIFSYNRFSGWDRQQTGLWATLGGRYQANFSDGSWLELTGGKAIHLAGDNAFAMPDHAQTGLGSGLEDDLSYYVLGARGSPYSGTTFGTKLQLDPADFSVARAGIAAQYSLDRFQLGLDYIYLPATPVTGVTADQHEVTVSGKAPLPMDYWTVDGSLSWDIAQSSWLEAKGGLRYDDGYFEAGVFGSVTGPTHSSPDDTRFGLTLKIKGPGYSLGF